MATATFPVHRGQVWRNKKTFLQYEVLAIATCCDYSYNNQRCVIYTGEGALLSQCQDSFLQKMELISNDK